VANFEVNPIFGYRPCSVHFSDNSQGEITNWEWDFGDGDKSTSQNPVHEYTTAGCYTVKLAIEGTDGNDSVTKENCITISEPSSFHEIASDLKNDPVTFKVRDVFAGCDLDQDGKKEILLTDYKNGGRVHVYEFVADNAIEHVWSSSGTSSSNYAPTRTVKISDLDGNGRKEILLPVSRDNNENDHGFHVFEWDGTNDNGYGDGESICCCKVVGNWTTGYTENIAVDDLDNDGKQEVIYLNNGSNNEDGIFIYSCTGEFSKGNISWIEEAVFTISNGDFNGSPISISCGDLDKDNNREAIVGIWDDGAFLIIEAIESNKYEKRAYFKTTPGTDDYCIKDIILSDFDNDDNPDILFNLYTQGKVGLVHNISSLEDLNNNANISFIFENSASIFEDLGSSLGMAYSDQDDDGEPNLFLAQWDHGSLVDVEYTGTGDRTLAENYDVRYVYWDQSGFSGGSFAVFAPECDLDGDNSKEVIVTFLDGSTDANKIWFRVFEYDPTTIISEWQVILPKRCILKQNYPNPFNPTTNIEYNLSKPGNVTIEVYNNLGQKIETLIKKFMPAGNHIVEFNGKNLSSGVYYYKIFASDIHEIRKMVLLK
jgi:PKD repeat protein